MKKKEFMDKVEGQGCVVKNHYTYLAVELAEHPYNPLATVDERYVYVDHINPADIYELTVEERKTLFKLASEYAATPIEER